MWRPSGASPGRPRANWHCSATIGRPPPSRQGTPRSNSAPFHPRSMAAQGLAVMGVWALPLDRTNPNGSGISLGHPIGATGCILTVKALYELRRIGGKYALVTMCIGGGQGIAAIFEAM